MLRTDANALMSMQNGSNTIDDGDSESFKSGLLALLGKASTAQ
jgi:hypothetical protein